MRDILGVSVLAIDGDAARARLNETIAAGEHERYAFLNAHGANLASTDASFRKVLTEFTVLPDGTGVDIASRWLYGETFPANLNGTDFVPSLLADAPVPLRVGLWGAEPGVADAAVAAWSKSYPQHFFSTVAHGFAGDEDRDNALIVLEKSPIDLLLVAMGNPRQELFIRDHIDRRHARVVMGVGALFDFVAGRIPRAPMLLRKARSEWIFRLGLEPKRMFRRYVIGNPTFLMRVRRQKRARNG